MNTSDAPAFGNFPSLAGQTVFVTGGSSGIGADIVVAFARQGAKVGFTGRNAEAAAKVVADAKAVGPEPLFLKSDAADVEALRSAIAQTAARFGDIGVLINNVANDERHDIADVTEADFDWRVAINLKPAFFAAQAVIEGMKRLGGGAIVNVGSVSWKIKGAGYPVYARPGQEQDPRQHALAGLDHDREATEDVGGRSRRARDGREPVPARAHHRCRRGAARALPRRRGQPHGDGAGLHDRRGLDMSSSVDCVWDAACRLGEGLVWDAGLQSMFFVDIKGRAVHAYTPAKDQQRSWPMPEMIGWLVPRRGGD